MSKVPSSSRIAKFVVSPAFRSSYQEHLAKFPNLEEKLILFKEFKQLRPPKRLPAGFRDHTLSGELAGFRECHLGDDILLIYLDKKDVVTLLVICRHDDLTRRSFAEKLKDYRV